MILNIFFRKKLNEFLFLIYIRKTSLKFVHFNIILFNIFIT